MSKHAGKRGDFWSKVNIQADKDSCWEWLGTKNGDGYGEVRIDKVLHKAHRIAWKSTNGEIPEGLEVCHKCDNPPCCNPNHLFLGTHSENVLDMWNKGRGHNGTAHLNWKPDREWARGSNSGSAKLTESEVLEIRRLVSEGKLSRVRIGKIFKVTDVLVGKIERREIWTHI